MRAFVRDRQAKGHRKTEKRRRDAEQKVKPSLHL
jgi:hypothetical protein